MKFAKTFCKPGAVVEIAPVGIPVRLEYNEHGLLKAFDVYAGLDKNDTQDIRGFSYNETFQALKQLDSIPQSISINGGTTWVFGVLHSHNISYAPGDVLGDNFIAESLKMLLNGVHFEFFAGYASSFAVQMNSNLAIRNILASNKFKLLPQVIVPVQMTEDTLRNLMSKGGYSFEYPFISAFYIFEGDNCRFIYSNFIQDRIEGVDLELSKEGYWMGVLHTSRKTDIIVNYGAVVKFNIQKGSTILYQNDGPVHILASRNNADKTPVSHIAKCPVCGKRVVVPAADLSIQCDDPHCLSVSYPQVCKMTKTLEIPGLSYEAYLQHVKNKDMICITDLFTLPEYKDLEVQGTLEQAISSVVPVSVSPTSSLFNRFVVACNNSVETITYYLNNPQRIIVDLNLETLEGKRFVEWLADPYNASTVETMLAVVKYAERTTKFDGDPIFRNNNFIITGKFKRGTAKEIEAILRSYSANVYKEFDSHTKINTVIVGDLNDGVSGAVLRGAKEHSIPIVAESDFFKMYHIDEDVAAANLL